MDLRDKKIYIYSQKDRKRQILETWHVNSMHNKTEQEDSVSEKNQ